MDMEDHWLEPLGPLTEGLPIEVFWCLVSCCSPPKFDDCTGFPLQWQTGEWNRRYLM
jgi:hypothetical protein